MSWADVMSEGNTSDKTPIAKFEAGNTIIRVLDSEPHSYWSHWMVKQQQGISCLGTGCPVCDVIKQQKADGVKDRSYTSSKRHAMRILNKNTNQMEVMIQGKNFMQDLLTLHKEVGDIRDYDIKVVRKGTGTDTTYTLLPVAPQPLTDDEKKLISEVNMEEFFKPLDKDVVIQLMEGKTFKEIYGQGDEQ